MDHSVFRAAESPLATISHRDFFFLLVDNIPSLFNLLPLRTFFLSPPQSFSGIPFLDVVLLPPISCFFFPNASPPSAHGFPARMDLPLNLSQTPFLLTGPQSDAWLSLPRFPFIRNPSYPDFPPTPSCSSRSVDCVFFPRPCFFFCFPSPKCALWLTFPFPLPSGCVVPFAILQLGPFPFCNDILGFLCPSFYIEIPCYSYRSFCPSFFLLRTFFRRQSALLITSTGHNAD